MKHLLIFISFLLSAPKIAFSQEQQKPQYTNYIFDPKADANQDLKNAFEKAKEQNKNVLVMVGGDWDYYCRFYNDAFVYDTAMSNIVESKFIYMRINFSPLNKNEEALAAIGCPKGEGYPIFMVLDKNGKKLHCQNADPFRRVTKYKISPVITFLNKWAATFTADSTVTTLK